MDSGSYSQHREVKPGGVRRHCSILNREYLNVAIPNQIPDNYRFNIGVPFNLNQIISTSTGNYRQDIKKICKEDSFREFAGRILIKCKETLFKKNPSLQTKQQQPISKSILIKNRVNSGQNKHLDLLEIFLVKTPTLDQLSQFILSIQENPFSSIFDNLRRMSAYHQKSVVKWSIENFSKMAIKSPLDSFLIDIMESTESEEFIESAAEICLNEFDILIQNPAAINVMVSMTKRSAFFSNKLIRLYKDRLPELITSRCSVKLLTTMIEREIHCPDTFKFVIKYLDSLEENDVNNCILDILNSLVSTSDQETLAELGDFIRRNIKAIIDKPVGYHIFHSLLQRTKNSKLISIYEDFCREFPVQIFVRKQRKMLFYHYLEHDSCSQELLGFIVTFMAKKKSNMRYILKKEDSVYLFLSAICRTRDLPGDKIKDLSKMVGSIVEGYEVEDDCGKQLIESAISCLECMIDENYSRVKDVLKT